MIKLTCKNISQTLAKLKNLNRELHQSIEARDIQKALKIQDEIESIDLLKTLPYLKKIAQFEKEVNNIETEGERLSAQLAIADLKFKLNIDPEDNFLVAESIAQSSETQLNVNSRLRWVAKEYFNHQLPDQAIKTLEKTKNIDDATLFDIIGLLLDFGEFGKATEFYNQITDNPYLQRLSWLKIEASKKQHQIQSSVTFDEIKTKLEDIAIPRFVAMSIDFDETIEDILSLAWNTTTPKEVLSLLDNTQMEVKRSLQSAMIKLLLSNDRHEEALEIWRHIKDREQSQLAEVEFVKYGFTHDKNPYAFKNFLLQSSGQLSNTAIIKKLAEAMVESGDIDNLTNPTIETLSPYSLTSIYLKAAEKYKKVESFQAATAQLDFITITDADKIIYLYRIAEAEAKCGFDNKVPLMFARLALEEIKDKKPDEYSLVKDRSIVSEIKCLAASIKNNQINLPPTR